MQHSTRVIGICGKKFNGKDTIADYLVEEYGYTKISLGDPLKNALKCIFGFTDEQLWGAKKEEIDTYWGVSPRIVMQYIGTNCLRNQFGKEFPDIGDKIWVRALHKQIEQMIERGVDKIVVPDLRFPNEECIIRDFDGIIIRVIRPEMNSNDVHESENSLDKIKADHIIYNNTYEQLYKDIDLLFH